MKFSAAVLAVFVSAFCALELHAATDFVPRNPPEMKPLANPNSPAHQAAKLFQHGINLGNYLEVPPGQNWRIEFAPDEFARMREQGFDHVRVPIGWHHYAGPAPDFRLSPEIFSKVDFVVTNALSNHLNVIINDHGFDAFTSNPKEQTPKLIAIWKQIAAHYAQFPNTLAFEILNEPKGAATTAVMNPIYEMAIAEIRKTNPHRAIFVGPGRWNGIDELKNLILPASDDNLIVAVHCYEPFYFTHQGASWTGNETKVTGIEFPGPPKTPLKPNPAFKLSRWTLDWIHHYNTEPTAKNPSSRVAFEPKLKQARAWSDFYGRPVHVGEFGCYTKADPASRARFLTEFRRVLDEQKLPWAMWDWSAGFRYWDRKKNEPMPGLHAALFGK